MLRSFEIFRGRERTRTAVEGFADLCLATRPRDLEDCKCSKKTFPVKKKLNPVSVYNIILKTWPSRI